MLYKDRHIKTSFFNNYSTDRTNNINKINNNNIIESLNIREKINNINNFGGSYNTNDIDKKDSMNEFYNNNYNSSKIGKIWKNH